VRICINRALERLNYDSVLVKRDRWRRFWQDASRWQRIRPFACTDGLTATHAAEILEILGNVDELRSQFGQDAFVLSQLLFKKGGHFVDFGATDGVLGSNSYILERRYGWTGILAEPARCWHAALQRNRDAHIEFSCVSDTSGRTIAFYEKGVLSTARSPPAFERKLRRLTKPGRFYQAPTISLLDLLQKHDAPPVVDYLSLDTEGTELQIFGAFDFSAFCFRGITCEHNYSPNRERIQALLSAHG